MKTAKIHPLADEEMFQASEYYKNKRPGYGEKFRVEINRLIDQIEQAPARFRHFKGTYQRNIAIGFPYAVVYKEFPDYILIIAVMHMHRKDGYWLDRV